MRQLTESIVEWAALAWLESLGWTLKHSPEIAPGELAAERTAYGQAALEQRLRDALARLNPTLPPEALDDAFRKVSRPEGPTLEARRRVVRRVFAPAIAIRHRFATIQEGLLPQLISEERQEPGVEVRGYTLNERRLRVKDAERFIAETCA